MKTNQLRAMLPTIETGRLIVRPRSLQDLENCLSMDRDPLVTRYIPGPWSEPKEHRAFVLARMNKSYPDGHGYWSVLRKGEPQQFLGWILLLPYRAFGDETEIGWRFARKSCGKGYATEAAAAVLQHAFETLALEYVIADIDPQNTASLRVAEKLGMRYVGDRALGGELAKSYRAGPQDI